VNYKTSCVSAFVYHSHADCFRCGHEVVTTASDFLSSVLSSEIMSLI